MATLREQIEALYIGYLNRAPDPAGLGFWLDAANSGLSLAAIAQSFSVQDETRAIYGEISAIGAGGSAAAQEAFMLSVYANLFGRTEVDTAGMTFWRAQLNSGASVGSIIMNIISGAQGNDAVVVSNKLVVADYFTTQLAAKNATFSLEAAKTAFANVTASPASITTALTNVDTVVSTLPPVGSPPPVVTPPPVVVDAPPPPPPPPLSIEGTDGDDEALLTGTAGADVINGLGGNDRFFVSAGGDTLNGGTGIDDFVFVGGGGTPSGLTINGGDDSDGLVVGVSTNFSALNGGGSLADASLERLLISTNGATAVTATFTGAQISGKALSVNTFNSGTPGASVATLTINASGLQDFSGLTFEQAFPGANNAFVSGTDLILINGSAGADAITGTGITDVFFSSLGADTLSGGGGNDVFFYVGDPDITVQALGDTLVGGDGSDGVLAYFSTDFRGLSNTTLTDASIERIFIKTKGGGDGFDFDSFAIFNGNQLHDQAIVVNSYNDPNVADGARIAALSIFASGGANDFSTLDFADSSASAGFEAYDGSIFITGSAGADTVTGTSRTDFFLGFSSGDVMNGGGASDSFIFRAGDTADGVTINGGSDADTFDNINSIVSTDFTKLNGGVALLTNGIEAVLIGVKGPDAVTATFDGAQLSGQAISINTFNDPAVTDTANVATLTINATGTQDFSDLTFNPVYFNSTAFVSGTDIININGSAGDDSITGTSINDRFFSSLGADALNGGDGDDVLSYFGSFSSTVSVSGDPAVDHALGDTIAGGLGSDILLAYFSTDFRQLANATVKLMDDAGIETIAINDESDFDTYAIFNGSQLTDQAISVNRYHDPAVTPTTKFAALSIFASGAQNFSQLKFTDADSSSPNVTAFSTATGERIFISGVDGQADTITGTAMNDFFLVSTGGDSLDGGAGFDAFIFEAGDVAAGMTINGGADDDSLNANVSTNFSGLNGGATLMANSLERVFISTKGTDAVTATYDGAQLSGQAIHVNTFNSATVGASVATLAINVTGAGDFSLLDFASVFPTLNSFVSGTDIIIINGSAVADTITGTSINDIITGGGGADTLNGGGGDDTFIFDASAGATVSGITAGDTVMDFVINADKLNFSNVAEVASAEQAAVQAAVTALVTPTADLIATAMATANTTDLGVSSAVFEGDTYVYFERTGTGVGVAADDIFIKLTGVASGFSFAGDVVA